MPPKSHPNGAVRIRIADVRTVYNHTPSLTLGDFRRAGIRADQGVDTLATSSQVRRALNRRHQLDEDDDARSVLYDIDTQWGLLPHGGAYKESERYDCK